MSWAAVVFVPVLFALVLASARLSGFAQRVLLPLAPLPALAMAVFGPATAAGTLDTMLLGVRFGFGPAGRVFLFFTAVLWLVAAIYSQGYLARDERRARFCGFMLVTMAGNFGLIIAQDVPAFYTCFAVMTFSAFGLVIHTGTAEARRAARIYLITAVFGEALLLGAIFLAVSEAESMLLADLAPAVAASELRNLIVLLAFFGFGVKAGALPVHLWLPLAHPVAPVPASAVLSGAMIKAGLLGWTWFLPLGQGTFPGWSGFCIAAGLAAAFYAVLVGYTQDDPKTVLAYSSISQMGVMTVALGIGLVEPDAWRAALPVLLLYAMNHALAKGALFLGTGVAYATGAARVGRWLVIGGLALPALAIAGAPWTGGGMAKYALKDAAALGPEQVVPWLDWLLPVSAVGTSLLLGRFLWLVWWSMKSKPAAVPHLLMTIPWVLLLVGVAATVLFAIRFFALEIATSPASPATIWAGMWPILAGLVLLLVAGRLLGGQPNRFTIPAGDIVVWFERAALQLRDLWRRVPVFGPSRWQINFVEPLERLAESERRTDLASRMEAALRNRELPGLLFILLALAMVALLILGAPVR
jgi:formate hydrogenlyase subunit 3/multisubunit Na+/H+ antiporter MnhD subunit